MLLAFSKVALTQPQVVEPENETRKQAVENWRDMGFGMFIHWGAYTRFKGKYEGLEMNKDLWGEWIMKRAGIPIPKYEQTVKTFNPDKFNPEVWAGLAKKAGMKYMVITSKHHDGFAMYHSKASKYNIVDFSGFNRDPMKELSDACNKQGVAFGFYYSHRADWHAAGAAGYKGDDKSKTFDDYWKTKCIPQVDELTKNYGDLAVMWFDLGGKTPPDKAEELRNLVLKNQPLCVIDSRIGAGQGDYLEQKDRFVPETVIETPWETCMTFNHHWAWYPQDVYHKKAVDIIQMLASVRSMGGNLLLNVGPDNTGRIPLVETVTLLETGKWLNKYGDAIYSVNASPLPVFPWGRCTRKANKLYLFVFNWPADGTLFIPGLLSPVSKIYPMNFPEDNSIKSKQTELGVELTVLPEKIDSKWLDRDVTVLTLEFEEPLKTSIVRVLDHDFDNEFKAVTAEKSGALKVKNLRYSLYDVDSKIRKHEYVTRFINFEKDAEASWTFNNETEDIFHVIVKYSLNSEKTEEEANFVFTCAGKEYPVTLKPTCTSFGDPYVKVVVADTKIAKGRNLKLTMRMTSPDVSKDLEIVSVILKPSHLK
jgi:alpha-L-fucosidase